jgi:hypothetical protein
MADGLVDINVDDEHRPIMLAVSDNGPQMTSGSTREFIALCAIAQHFGRPGTPTHQAWIESLNGHVKVEYPHLLAIRDPATLRAELAVTREHYNAVRLYAGIGYVTPNDEHEGRGEAIGKDRRAGLEQAGHRRLAWPASTGKINTRDDPTMLVTQWRPDCGYPEVHDVEPVARGDQRAEQVGGVLEHRDRRTGRLRQGHVLAIRRPRAHLGGEERWHGARAAAGQHARLAEVEQRPRRIARR